MLKRPTFNFDKDLFKRSVEYNVRTMYRRTMKDATDQQVFQASAMALKDQIIDCWMRTQKVFDDKDPKQVVYLSMEFLMGRAFGNDAINLMAYEPIKQALKELGFKLNAIEDEEPDAALGNGGLGRLAACFLDSLATLNYPAYGAGIRYHYGMFKQQIRDGYQVEVPDNWLENGNPLELRRPEYTQEVHFGGYVANYKDRNGRTMYKLEGYSAVKAVPYDLPVIGYGNGFVDTLRIWDAEPVVCFKLDSFDRGEYQKSVEQENLARTFCNVLYPCDDHVQGKELRLKQQYFFVSATIQCAIQKYMKTHDDIRKLPEKYVFQLNDTHPTLVIPELMRILMDEYALTIRTTPSWRKRSRNGPLSCSRGFFPGSTPSWRRSTAGSRRRSTAAMTTPVWMSATRSTRWASSTTDRSAWRTSRSWRASPSTAWQSSTQRS